MRFGSDSSVELWIEYEYDDNGNQIKATWYHEDGSVDWWEEYEYGFFPLP